MKAHMLSSRSRNQTHNRPGRKAKRLLRRVIEKFGTDHMIQLLDMMKRLETVMSLELDEKGGSSDDETAE